MNTDTESVRVSNCCVKFIIASAIVYLKFISISISAQNSQKAHMHRIEFESILFDSQPNYNAAMRCAWCVTKAHEISRIIIVMHGAWRILATCIDSQDSLFCSVLCRAPHISRMHLPRSAHKIKLITERLTLCGEMMNFERANIYPHEKCIRIPVAAAATATYYYYHNLACLIRTFIHRLIHKQYPF